MTIPQLYRKLADVTEENEALRAENASLRAENSALKQQVPAEQKQWFSCKEASAFINMSVGWLNKDRITDPPVVPFTKAGHRKVFYDRKDLVAFLDAKKSRKKRGQSI